jgi:hypothetical protein
VDNLVSLRPLLHQLPPGERRILTLRYFEELTQQEIGQRVGVTQMQVSRLLTRTLIRLREDLAPRFLIIVGTQPAHAEGVSPSRAVVWLPLAERRKAPELLSRLGTAAMTLGASGGDSPSVRRVLCLTRWLPRPGPHDRS